MPADATSLVTPPFVEPARHEELEKSWLIQSINLVVIVTPFIGFVIAAVFLRHVAFGGAQSIIFAVMLLLTAMGITVGFHRLFTHRSFETSRTLTAMFAILGSMAVEGPLLDWVALHRRHHQHSDEQEDPHSPHLHGEGLWGMVTGLWHAHVGWMFEREPDNLEFYVGDLAKDPVVTWISNAFPLWALASLAIPAALGGLITRSWSGVVVGLFWGGFARIFFVHHVTWSINSVCHMWGSRDFECHDESRNNVVLGVLAMGEGWHNNHHAFPTSAKHGIRWWQIDASYWLIRTLELTGLARKVRRPTKQAIAAKVRVVRDAVPTPSTGAETTGQWTSRTIND